MPKSPKDASLASDVVAPATILFTPEPDPTDDIVIVDKNDERLPRGLHLGDGVFHAHVLPDGRLFVLDLPPATQARCYPDLPPADPPLPPPTLPSEV